ncbi:MAG: glycoside hydrolase family 3 C-terminal domain-containing protein [Bacteroidales bacterium]|nr:glycoside hydrolase family 3 C-terminal domain-containing protein [Bacteroidales bacterium]
MDYKIGEKPITYYVTFAALSLTLNLNLMKPLFCFSIFWFIVGSVVAQPFPFQDNKLPVEERINDLIQRLNTEEKVALLEHQSPAVERLGIPPYSWWNEALHGVARAGTATVFPQAVALAATFDEEAMFQTFSIISDEARAKFNEAQRNKEYGDYHGLTFWTPNINIVRDPRWGRSMETYGEDPFLTARMGIAAVKGLQGNHPFYFKTHACAKHFAAHSGPEGIRHQFDAIVSERDLQTTYLPAFESLVKEADVQEVMCGYNRLNGDPCCANENLFSVLRNEWKFNGLIVSDCWAIHDFWQRDSVIPRHETHTTQKAAVADAFNSGIDLECGNSLAALKSIAGTDFLTDSLIHQRLFRVLKARIELGMFDADSLVPWSSISMDTVDCPTHRKMALTMAQKSIVLLKNEKHILPLSEKTKKIAVIGPNADDSTMLWGNYNGTPSHTTTFLQGIMAEKPKNCQIYFDKGCDLIENQYTPPTDFWQQIATSEVIVFVGGISPQLEGEELKTDFEGFSHGDRTDLELPKVQKTLLQQLKSTGKPIILVLCTGSAIALNWENDHLDAIINAWYGGQAAGTALADVLFGTCNPAGRLPVTFYQSVDQLPPFEDYSMQNRTYRYMTQKPLYPFGFGLSYSTFKYLLKKVTTDSTKCRIEIAIKNTGKVDGEEVAQIYLQNPNDPNAPQKTLVGFNRVFIPSGATKNVAFEIPEKYFHSFNDETQKMELKHGEFVIQFGKSSSDSDLKSVKIWF